MITYLFAPQKEDIQSSVIRIKKHNPEYQQLLTPWLTILTFFSIFLFIFWKLSNGPLRKEYGEKMWKLWSSRLYYWQSAIYASAALAVLVMFLLRWANVLTF